MIVQIDERSSGAAACPANQGLPDWCNNSGFVAPVAYTYGNAGRNRIPGPPFRTATPVSLISNDFEKFVLQFTAEALNMFDTPHFGLPKTQ